MTRFNNVYFQVIKLNVDMFIAEQYIGSKLNQTERCVLSNRAQVKAIKDKFNKLRVK